MLNICLQTKQRIAKPKQFTRGPSQARTPNAHKITGLMLGTHKAIPVNCLQQHLFPSHPAHRPQCPSAALQLPPLSLPT